MQIGIDSFAAMLPVAGDVQPSPAERMANLLVEIEAADRAGIDVFGIGEHHRAEFLDSAPSMILAAAAARTKNIRLTSAVTVLSADDPVRLFQQFATLDLLSNGRAEMIVGRGSFIEAYPLFGLDTADYDALFIEKLELLLKLRSDEFVDWSGKFRPALRGQGVYPRPVQPQLPVWVGVGGTPNSFARAGALGLPLMVAIIGGTFERFAPLVQLYRDAGKQAGFAPDQLKVGLHVPGLVADSFEAAIDAFYPGWSHMIGTIGGERGWSPPNRRQFEAGAGPNGIYLLGDPQTVADKMAYASQVLGGVARITVQKSSVSQNHGAMLRSIELLGTRTKPLLEQALAAAAS